MCRQQPRVTSKSAATTVVLLNDLINHPAGTMEEKSNTLLFPCTGINLTLVSVDSFLA